MDEMGHESGFSKWRHRHPRLFDYAAYLAISSALAGTILFATIQDVPWAIISRFICFGVPTVIVACSLISKSRAYWGYVGFWTMTAILLSIHVIVSATVIWNLLFLKDGRTFGGIVFAQVVIEIPVFMSIRDKILSRTI